MPVETTLPLSAQQEFHWETLWFREGDLRSGGRDGPFLALRLSGHLNTGAFVRALQTVTDVHDALRVRIGDPGSDPHQRIASEMQAPLSIIDLTNVPETRRAQLTQNVITAENRSNFDLTNGPLWSALLLVLSDTEHVFALHFCHLVLDGLSLIALLQDLSTVYNGGPLGSRQSYRSGVEASLETPHDLERRLEFWRRHIPPRNAANRYPTDHSDSSMPFVSTAIQTFESSLSRTDIQAVTRASSATTFTRYLAAYATLIAFQSGNDRVVFGSSTSVANPLSDDHALGYHLNLMLIPVTVRRDESLAELLGQIGEMVSSALDLSVPYRRLARELHRRFDDQRPWPAMLFYDTWLRGRVLGVIADNEAMGLSLHGLKSRLFSLTRGYSDWDLTNDVQRKASRDHVLPSLYLDTANGSSGYFEYNRALYREPTIKRMAHRIDLLMQEMFNPGTSIDDAWLAVLRQTS